MVRWIKKHSTMLIAAAVTIGFMFYAYGCEPRVRSPLDGKRLISRAELQLELEQFIGKVEFLVADLDRQERFRALFLQNALALASGQPINPIGILTGVATIYGVTQGGRNITKVVKTARNKRKVKNGDT